MTESSSKNASVVAECLRSWNEKAVSEVVEFHGETTIVVPRELLRAAAERCRTDASLQFNFLTDATCVDRFPAEPRFELGARQGRPGDEDARAFSQAARDGCRFPTGAG